MFPYALLPHQEGAKRDTVGVTRGASVKQPHHKGHVTIYPMEKRNVTCTSSHRMIRMCLYNQRQRKPK